MYKKVQNTAVRLIPRTRKFDHVTQILNFHWLPVEYRSQYKLLLFVYKALNICAPSYLSDIFKIHWPPRSRSVCSENLFLLDVPQIRTVNYVSRRFDNAATSLWNSLNPSVLTFQIRLCFYKRPENPSL
jgi:hypothetical protein